MRRKYTYASFLSVSLVDIAKKTGIDRSHVYKIFYPGYSAQESTIQRIADAFGVSLPLMTKWLAARRLVEFEKRTAYRAKARPRKDKDLKSCVKCQDKVVHNGNR